MNDKVKSYLISLKDDKLLEFEQKLNMKSSNSKHLGIRIPIIRNYAKELSKLYDLDYLYQNIDEEYYEMLMLKGFLISSYILSFNDLKKYLNDFVPKIYDWGICDCFCASLKITKKYLKDMWVVINEYLNSKKEFEVRFALVMLLDYYLIDDYIDKVLVLINEVKLDKYYVKMANAWLISFCLIKYYDKTYLFLKDNNSLDNWTINKAITKARESYRLTKEQKGELNKLRR